jgi:hypothetical protein
VGQLQRPPTVAAASDDITLRLNELGADLDHRQARLALRAPSLSASETLLERSAASRPFAEASGKS